MNKCPTRVPSPILSLDWVVQPRVAFRSFQRRSRDRDRKRRKSGKQPIPILPKNQMADRKGISNSWEVLILIRLSFFLSYTPTHTHTHSLSHSLSLSSNTHSLPLSSNTHSLSLSPSPAQPAYISILLSMAQREPKKTEINILKHFNRNQKLGGDFYFSPEC